MREIIASIVVLTHNTKELVLHCLEGFCSEVLDQHWQVIVVDNASTDGTFEAVRKRFPGVEAIRSEENLGFAGGNNLGIRRAAGQLVILLNSDVLASAQALQGLADLVRGDNTIGAASPRLMTATGKAQAFAFGSEPISRILLSARGDSCSGGPLFIGGI